MTLPAKRSSAEALLRRRAFHLGLPMETLRTIAARERQSLLPGGQDTPPTPDTAQGQLPPPSNAT